MIQFEHDPRRMNKMCNGEFTWLNKSTIQIFDDGRLFTENNGAVQIYDHGFCVDTMVSGDFIGISALKCMKVIATQTCIQSGNETLNNSTPHLSCSRHQLDSKFRLAYTILGVFSLVMSFLNS